MSMSSNRILRAHGRGLKNAVCGRGCQHQGHGEGWPFEPVMSFAIRYRLSREMKGGSMFHPRARLFGLLLSLCACQPTGGGETEPNEVDAAPPIRQCIDREDNDGDGLTDYPFDPGCTSPADDDEQDERLPQCADGEDNDGDGTVDQADRGCAAPDDDDESDDPPLPQCANALDDDADGEIDLADRGCTSVNDDDEGDERPLAACENGEDDDGDMLTDFPDDPGCGSPEDLDETDARRPVPQCSDGIDNDGDGRVDLWDPGCAAAADARELDPEQRPACSNGRDDDDDGVVDFPLEPGCIAAGDDEETDGMTPPECGNGQDDDEDGWVDFPDDPGCAGVGDRDELDPLVVPPCLDGVDNDRDGRTDYPDDLGCAAAADGSERSLCGNRLAAVELTEGLTLRGNSGRGTFQHQGSCGGNGAAEVVFTYRLDRPVEALELTTSLPDNALETALYVRRDCVDPASELHCVREPLADGVAANTLRLESPPPGVYFFFLDGATGMSGTFAVRLEAVPLAACLNGEDDDGDGRIDYPDEPGCDTYDDRDETDPEIRPACGNDEDDDGDGEIDFPLDVGCYAASDRDEDDVCGQGIPVVNYPVGEPFVEGTTEGGSAVLNGRCGGDRAERIFRYDNPHNANLVLSVNHPRTEPHALLYVRRQCATVETELGCALSRDEAGDIRLENVPPGVFYLVVDTALGLGGPFRLTVQSERLAPGCSDAIDNDEDGFIDADDVGCGAPDDEDERNPDLAPACEDLLDNDGDGWVDYPWDPGCWGRGSDQEVDSDPMPQCADGVDNDDDGAVDFPHDVGCSHAGDVDEGNGDQPQCSNRVDDDNDSLLDFPYDPGCGSPGDRSERDNARPPACFDQADNDRDGLVDFPLDPGCFGAGDYSEDDPEPLPVCGNGVDDDEDGRLDFPRDPGCEYAGDPNDEDPHFSPACADGRDNDNDGHVDWPDDIGCRSAADRHEERVGFVPAQCADGVDNDGDGLTDVADRGCQNGRDQSEVDPAVVPRCADELDNDEDGAVDWPDDPGCAALGDGCESAAYGLCGDVCVPIQSDPENCGRCGRACDPGVECIEGSCGGLFTFEGIRQEVPEGALNGWEICHRDLFGDRGVRIDDLLAACDGQQIMYGCRRVGRPTWQLLAMGSRAEVFRETGDRNNNVTTHNGVDWYFSRRYSIGFLAPGSGAERNSCDVGDQQAEFRLCWHTQNNLLTGGYRCGAQTGLNNAQDWERVIWKSR